MITHDKGREKALLIRHGDQRYHYDEIEEAYDELLDYITQQEKVGKLLEIYRKVPICKLFDDLSDEDIELMDKLEEELK